VVLLEMNLHLTKRHFILMLFIVSENHATQTAQFIAVAELFSKPWYGLQAAWCRVFAEAH